MWAAKLEALLDASCHHCGRLPEADGDHTCLCPDADSKCFNHLADPVVSREGVRNLLWAAREEQ